MYILICNFNISWISFQTLPNGRSFSMIRSNLEQRTYRKREVLFIRHIVGNKHYNQLKRRQWISSSYQTHSYFREPLGKARTSQVNTANIALISKFHGTKSTRPWKSPLGYGSRIIIGESTLLIMRTKELNFPRLTSEFSIYGGPACLVLDSRWSLDLWIFRGIYIFWSGRKTFRTLKYNPAKCFSKVYFHI